MLITNGTMTRNISQAQLPEYVVKGYVEVKETEEVKETKKPRAKKPKD